MLRGTDRDEELGYLFGSGVKPPAHTMQTVRAESKQANRHAGKQANRHAGKQAGVRVIFSYCRYLRCGLGTGPRADLDRQVSEESRR